MRIGLAAALWMGACALVHAQTPAAAAPSPIAPPDFHTQFKDSITALPDASDLTIRGTIYVPTYSRVYGAAGSDRKQLQFSTTLRIDNTSATKPLVIERIEYYETTGKLVQSYLAEPLALRPFGTIEIVIPAEDERGGPAANFIVNWAGAGPIAEPMVEAVMIGSQDNTSYSFVSTGRPIRHLGRSAWPQFRFRF
ncbi:MAG TPA: DUF3124 domain-containing protein [Xanthobacteraceae bacterium]|nr:DUF3124 domain-containing protein [Xanthobacteraceae bacterium]